MAFLNSFLLFVLGIFVIFSLLFLIFLCFNVISLFFGAPYVKSKKKAMEEMLKIAQIKKDDVIFDLGSGDGALLIKAAKKYRFKEAWGVEINPILALLSKIKIILSGTQGKIKIKQGNFLKEYLKEATIIFTYLLPGIQVKLEKKFQKELRPGTRIISNSFPFPNLILKQKIQCSGLGKMKTYIREYTI